MAVGGGMIPMKDSTVFTPLSIRQSAKVGATLHPDGIDSKILYTAALQPSSPHTKRKCFDDVGDDFKEASIYNNKPALFYSKEEVSGMAFPYRFLLIGKFAGLRPKHTMVLQEFSNLGLSSFYNLRFLRSGYVFIHLTSNVGMARVWTYGIWYIEGVPMHIFKWSPHFSYEVESLVILVWVQMPDLLIHMFSKKGFFTATSIIGKPIKIDETTADGSKLSVKGNFPKSVGKPRAKETVTDGGYLREFSKQAFDGKERNEGLQVPPAKQERIKKNGKLIANVFDSKKDLVVGNRFQLLNDLEDGLQGCYAMEEGQVEKENVKKWRSEEDWGTE
ncbi:hypothetical protein ZIOFF_028505 [Zingiber officinale]|uniref:DUF4283 domain-containing protein n=1 Tax=Zingiber officinale TaxID=94328 RepID=A0A8J5GV58_ZINOF|nr:hypothetical protein ZIOFF_028505 [Zingiber officinale]